MSGLLGYVSLRREGDDPRKTLRERLRCRAEVFLG